METVSNETIESKAAKSHFIGLWEIVKLVEDAELQKSFQAYSWHWSVLEPLMREVGRKITLEQADRRVVILSNPGATHKHHSTNTLYVSCSIYNPGEEAPVHRHTANASRFVLHGAGGYTTIEGEKCAMSRGDLIVTPAGTWHDHGNEGDEPVIWVDVLDLPLVENLAVSHFDMEYFESGAKKTVQTTTLPEGYSHLMYGSGGLRPTFVQHVRGESIGTPMFVYRWSDSIAALQRIRHLPGSPFDGIILDYVNPVNGEAVTSTMNFAVQMLRPGEVTRSHRQTISKAYCCLEGHGRTHVGDKVIEWGPNDMFVIPNWLPHSHVNGSGKEDAILYSVTDAPAMKKLGLYKEEACD